ncbi:MAG: hypothetical protein KDA68_22330, partial [Planctomycetaceae bacterium]|nr:hypothetical protein [Planctomycetaceae bacterium]
MNCGLRYYRLTSRTTATFSLPRASPMTTEGFRVGGTPGDLFKGTARDYSEHRHPYPPEVIEHLVEIGGLDGTGRLLD